MTVQPDRINFFTSHISSCGFSGVYVITFQHKWCSIVTILNTQWKKDETVLRNIHRSLMEHPEWFLRRWKAKPEDKYCRPFNKGQHQVLVPT